MHVLLCFIFHWAQYSFLVSLATHQKLGQDPLLGSDLWFQNHCPRKFKDLKTKEKLYDLQHCQINVLYGG